MTRTGDDPVATVLVLAGRSLDIDTAVAQAHAYPKVTVARYDLPGPGPGDALTADDIARTHKVRSRISHAQRDWFIRTSVDAPWAAVPGEARLVDADPNVTSGLYDGAEALYEHFRTGGRKPKLGARQIEIAQSMYETDDAGKRKYTVHQIANEFGVTRPTIYRHLQASRHGHRTMNMAASSGVAEIDAGLA